MMDRVGCGGKISSKGSCGTTGECISQSRRTFIGVRLHPITVERCKLVRYNSKKSANILNANFPPVSFALDLYGVMQ
jgi:hypothetical protein